MRFEKAKRRRNLKFARFLRISKIEWLTEAVEPEWGGDTLLGVVTHYWVWLQLLGFLSPARAASHQEAQNVWPVVLALEKTS